MVLFKYITRLASKEIFSPSNKIHREVGRTKDLSAPLAHFFLEWEMNQSCKENQNIFYFFFIFLFFFSPKNSCPYKMIWKSVVQPDIPKTTIWRMRIGCWTPTATHAVTICNAYCSSTAKMVARTCLNVTLYVHCLPLL